MSKQPLKTLMIRSGVNLSSGDLVALDMNGQVIKASKVYDPIGVVVCDKTSGELHVRSKSGPYILDKFAKLIPSQTPTPSQKMAEAFEEFRSKDISEQKRLLGVALNSASVGDSVSVSLGGFQLPKMPDLPLPQLPSIPKIPSFGIDMTDIPIPADKEMTRTIWVGLFKASGEEVSSSDYKRIKLQLKGGITKNRIEFPMAQSAWGTIVRVGLFAAEKSTEILLEFTFGGSGSAPINPGDSVCIDNVEIECEPIASVQKPVEDLSVDEATKGSLKQRMNATRDALRKLKDDL